MGIHWTCRIAGAATGIAAAAAAAAIIAAASLIFSPSCEAVGLEKQAGAGRHMLLLSASSSKREIKKPAGS